jgi:DNA-directed RNA polymerase subunit E'/Rpb7
MSSPYINTRLYARVTILPNQMNNDIYSHMKSNLIKRLEGKCYRDYGFIIKIYEILDRSDGHMEPENPMAAALYKVKFSCRLCIPLKDKYIISKVERTIPMLTSLSSGPIRVIVTNDRINKDNFMIGKNGILVKSNIGTRSLNPGDHVKVRIDSRKFNDSDSIIMCMGVLESMATAEESNRFASDEYNISDKFIDYDKYIRTEEKQNDATAVGEETGEELKEDERDLNKASSNLP